MVDSDRAFDTIEKAAAACVDALKKAESPGFAEVQIQPQADWPIPYVASGALEAAILTVSAKRYPPVVWYGLSVELKHMDAREGTKLVVRGMPR